MGGTHTWDVGHTCNSLLGGLVGITAGCSVVTAHHALLIGFISAWVYHGASCMMRKLKIDDPLDAFAVHGACGFWGVLAVGLFAHAAYSYAPHPDNPLYMDGTTVLGVDAGLFMPGTRGMLFVTQLITLLGIFRISQDEEAVGMDVSKHGGGAYTNA